MKVGCSEVIPLLGAWLDRELASSDAARVEGHVMECPACSDRMAIFAAQGEALRVSMKTRVEIEDLSGLTRAVVAKVELQRRRRIVRRPVAAAMALAAAVAGVAVGLRTVWSPPPEVQGPVRLASIDEVDFRGEQGFVLQSGRTSIIWLREGAAR